MKKYFLIITLLFIILGSYGQLYLTDPDYKYGVGFGTTVQEADKMALANLSTKFSVSVATESRLSLVEEERVVTQEYNNHTYTGSAMVLKNTEQEIIKEDGEFKVYRYINTKKYVMDKQMAAKMYLDRANNARNPNYKLGYLYKAFQIMSDEVLGAFDSEVEFKRLKILDEINSVIGNHNLIQIEKKEVRLDYNSVEGFCYLAIHCPGKTNTTPKFEFLYGGKWVATPTFIVKEYGQINSNKDIIVCYINSRNYRTKLYYRLIFEVVDDRTGTPVRIDIPEALYGDKYVTLHPNS